MKAIKRSWKTLKDSLSIVGKYRSYSLYPLLSYIAHAADHIHGNHTVV